MPHPFAIVTLLTLVIRLGLWLNRHRKANAGREAPAAGLVPRSELDEPVQRTRGHR
ncbi:hypothetical protein AB0C76_26510 [Kitasatospora sp. NPDC048722]|uniref:hypothetical protein n=1 Tax=Kitasatospora sp. NPDC048722 TaxID=3155639 RepID=UPI003404F535